jgi:hypothetical protein
MYHAAVVRLYEPVIYMSSEQSSSDGFLRIEALGSCIQAIKMFFESLFDTERSTYLSMPFPWLACTAFVAMISCRLLLVKHEPDWDIQLARKTIDLPAHLERLAGGLAECERLLTGSITATTQCMGMDYSDKMRAISYWYQSKIHQEGGQINSAGSIPDFWNTEYR